MNLPAFETIAKPHRDIARGLFTADTYAAKLGQVVKKEGPMEYKSAQQFFNKTYVTEGLKGLLSGVQGRLKGHERKNQDPIIQLQTPFGGGKTHTLIALYHKAKEEWNATPIVIVGSEIETSETFWGQIEKQLNDGEIQEFSGNVAPGSNKILNLFRENNTPILILMDEVLQYLTRAAGVSVEESTLAKQTLAFMLSLTEAVTDSSNVAFVVTLQASEIQPLAAQFPLFKDLLNRMKRTVTPVEDREIASIIRSRLFSKDDFNHNEAKKVVREFAKYAKNENILSEGTQESEYREQFIESYPFQPEVIDVLYQRWGSFPDFQRTRGVLRLLSRVVHCTCGKNRPYITLADFDLTDNDIREALLEHTGSEYRSIIASDITGANAGAKTVDKKLGSTNEHLALGTRTATATFLYSFTGGMERGATLNEIKRSAAVIGKTSATIDTAKNRLDENLFYLRDENGKLYFDTQPNLKRIVQTRMENIDDQAVETRVHSQLQKCFKPSPSGHLKTYISPNDGSNIQDNEDLKLIVLPKRYDNFCQNLIENRGGTPRIYRNTVFFLTPPSGEAEHLKAEIKKVIAYEEIKKDTSLNLSPTQKKEIEAERKQSETALNNALRKDFRNILIPAKDGLSAEDLGIPAQGMDTALDKMIYEMLRAKSKILTSIGPKNIAIRYLKENEYLSTPQLLHSSLRTPGETIVLRDAWEKSIRQGVADGRFGLGEKANGMLIPHHFKSPLSESEIVLDNNEVIIHPNLIQENITPEDILNHYLQDNDTISTSIVFQYNPQSSNEPRPCLNMWKSAIQEGVKKGTFGIGTKVDDKPIPSAFRQEPSSITWGDSEVLIRAAICELIFEPPPSDLSDEGEDVDIPHDDADDPLPDPTTNDEDNVPSPKKTIGIKFTLPQGKVSNIAQHLNQLQAKFQNMQLELKTSDGEISQDAYEELKENLRELGTEIEEV